MTTLPEMAATPGTIQLNGDTYRISPLKLSEFAEFERWVEDTPIRRAIRNLASVPEELQGTILREAQREAAESRKLKSGNAGEVRKSLMERQLRMGEAMMTVEGTTFLLYLSLRKQQPELNQQQISELVTIDRLPYIQQTLDDINGFGANANPRKRGSRKKTPRTQSTGA